MTQRLNKLDRAAARLANAQTTPLRDERETAVQNEAATFGMIVGAFGWYVIATGLALVGQLFAMMVVLVGIGVPFAASMWYAGRRSVAYGTMTPSQSGASKRREVIIVVPMLLLGITLMWGVGYTLFTGGPLIPVDVDNASPGPLTALVVLWLLGPLLYGHYRRRKADRAADED